jgi:hypothetical protein
MRALYRDHPFTTEVTIQAVEVAQQDDAMDTPEMSPHPLGSVLLRLELAIAVIQASRRQTCPAKAKARIRRLR